MHVSSKFSAAIFLYHMWFDTSSIAKRQLGKVREIVVMLPTVIANNWKHHLMQTRNSFLRQESEVRKNDTEFVVLRSLTDAQTQVFTILVLS